MKLSKLEEAARKRVCLPLDGIKYLRTKEAGKNEKSIESVVKELSPVVGLFKIGKESFTRFGVDAIKLVQDYGANVFLDLKYYDIPNTLKGASSAATEKAVWMFNVHASGGVEMMREAKKAAERTAEEYKLKQPFVVGVTILTSIGPAEYLASNLPLVPMLTKEELRRFYGMKNHETEKQKEFAELLISKGYDYLTTINYNKKEPHQAILKGNNYHITDDKRELRCNVIDQEVLNLAQMSQEAGLDGIVCSAADLLAVKDKLPENFIYVTPGIKGVSTEAGKDQKRVLTAGKAISYGATYLVVGRAITGHSTAEERLQAGYEILQDIAKNL